MSIIARAFAVVGLLSVLGGCYVPEEFTATVTINKDGSYTYAFEGTVAHGLAAMAAKTPGLTQKEEQALKDETPKLKTGDVRRVEYVGKGRYETLIEHVGARNVPSYFPSQESLLFGIEPQGDGTIRFFAHRPTAKNFQDLQQAGLKLDGTIVVKLQNGVTVITQNADSQPSLFGLMGSYKWRINGPGATPEMIVRPGS